MWIGGSFYASGSGRSHQKSQLAKRSQRLQARTASASASTAAPTNRILRKYYIVLRSTVTKTSDASTTLKQ